MKKYTTLCQLIFLIILVIGVGTFVVLREEMADSLNKCSARLTLSKGERSFYVVLDFMTNTQTREGIVIISGKMLNEDNKEYMLKRIVNYVWEQEQDKYFFKSTKVTYGEDDDIEAGGFFGAVVPDFYLYPDKQIGYEIKKQDDYGYVFALGVRPLFICEF